MDTWLVLLFIAPFAPTGDAAASEVSRTPLTVDWAAYRAALDKVRRRPALPASGPMKADIARTELPVLFSTHRTVKGLPLFFTQGRSFTAHYALKGMSIAVMGSATQLVLPDDFRRTPAPGAAPRDMPYSFGVYDDISDLGFTRFGASYTIRASCTDKRDARCTQPAFLVEFMESLVPVER